ncbi:MAG: hypothetical protein A2452_08745 [Candidatus Firestonebacteria bacterium RIFOXYC2_FULL_39_67]|nr:MAG: hypothetical protein A2536_03310 [Candidatus Firestonebacteria bacterium RIFOXYD2_FULL_39_29]OGF53293.1 MAG: hypothetical protein A2452_08745 [Candidatus Firestonebacteria bacterium RIFOXYC2_FULL_39_67]OGF55165.1 MAG: hypothetical protein A2497_04720 [Candidatus Firestonebacteria bacterium RifOxyC12_full_39_7]
MNKLEALKELVKVGKKLDDLGYVIGPGGNTSIKCGNTVYIKASGASFVDCSSKDYVGVDLKTGRLVDGKRRPSCEVLAHLACYLANKDVGAVLHCHPTYAVAWGMTEQTLKGFNPEMVAIISSDVPVMKYMTSAGAPFADKLKQFIRRGFNAIIVQNHGLFVIAPTLKQALYRAQIVEESVKTVVAAKILGKMKYFTKAEWKEINEAEFEDYRRELLKMKK